MKHIGFIIFTLTSANLISAASGGIIIGPVRGQPGESVRLVTFSETKGDTVQKNILGKSITDPFEIIRERDIVWTFRAPAADGTRRGMVRVPKITTITKSLVGGKEQKITEKSPLVGKIFSMSKTPTADWKFELDGSVPLTRVQKEINELTVYLKRDWYPNRDLNVGDSWEFDPTWVRMLIDSEMSQTKTIATMRLRQVRTAEKRRVAVIDVSIQTSGGIFRSDGSQTNATVELTGEVIVNLETMLDELLELKGTISSVYIKGAESTKAKRSLRLLATKSFIKDSPMQ